MALVFEAPRDGHNANAGGYRLQCKGYDPSMRLAAGSYPGDARRVRVSARMSLPVTYEDVLEAAERISSLIVRTPSVPATVLSERTGSRVFLKLETRQRTGAFKDRGAASCMLTLSIAEKTAGVIAMSAGNHAQAVAYVAQRLGIPATIVMPETTPFTKVRRTQSFGARVVLYGDTLVDAAARAQEIIEAEGVTLVHPYDDPRIVAGQGTCALEFLADVPDLDVLLVPIGGGGLISGIAVAAKAIKPGIEIIGVQTELYPSFYRVLAGLEPAPGGPTVAEGIAVRAVGDVPLAIAREYVSDVILVSEQAIEEAIHMFLEEEKLVAEGAGAAPLAALLSAPERFRNRNVGLVVCGGNIDTGLLANVIVRARLRAGRVVRMRVEINDRPGMLADVARLIGECGANILDVTHQRLFHDVSSKNAELDITFEARSPSDVEKVIARLHEANYTTTMLESTLRPSRSI